MEAARKIAGGVHPNAFKRLVKNVRVNSKHKHSDWSNVHVVHLTTTGPSEKPLTPGSRVLAICKAGGKRPEVKGLRSRTKQRTTLTIGGQDYHFAKFTVTRGHTIGSENRGVGHRGPPPTLVFIGAEHQEAIEQAARVS